MSSIFRQKKGEDTTPLLMIIICPPPGTGLGSQSHKELSRLLNVSEQIIMSHAEELIKKGILQQL